MDEINLAAALQFVLDGALHQLVVVSGDRSLYRNTIFRRRLDHAHVPQADHGHVQRARNGRGAHGEHVHFFFELLQPLFVAHPEALLFIDDHQAEVAELQVFGEQPVRADHDVHFAGLDALDDLLLLPGAAEAAQHLDVDRERGEALLERLEVLEDEHRGRRQYHHLLVVAYCLEGGAHADFSFAVADIAAQQPVHRLAGFHVALDVAGGLELVFGLVVLERIFKLALPLAVG